MSAPKENGSCTPKEKALWRITEGAEKASRRAKLELSVRCNSLTLLPPLRNCIRFSHGAFGISDLWLQQAAVWLLCSLVWIASAAAARGAESMQISHAGDRRTRQRIVGGFSFGHPKPFSFCKKNENGVWETASFFDRRFQRSSRFSADVFTIFYRSFSDSRRSCRRSRPCRAGRRGSQERPTRRAGRDTKR